MSRLDTLTEQDIEDVLDALSGAYGEASTVCWGHIDRAIAILEGRDDQEKPGNGTTDTNSSDRPRPN